MWAGDGGEGAECWLQVLTEIKNRGVDDVCMVVCDGLKGLPDPHHLPTGASALNAFSIYFQDRITLK